MFPQIYAVQKEMTWYVNFRLSLEIEYTMLLLIGKG